MLAPQATHGALLFPTQWFAHPHCLDTYSLSIHFAAMDVGCCVVWHMDGLWVLQMVLSAAASRFFVLWVQMGVGCCPVTHAQLCHNCATVGA